MKTLLIFVLLLSISYAQVIDKSISGTKYFKSFDYSAAINKKSAFKIESELIVLSHKIIDYLDTNPNYIPTNKKQTSKEDLAMILVYSGMLLMNNNNGVIEGEYSREELFAYTNISKSDSISSEINARYLLSESFLQYAQAMEPDNIRIMAWHSSNQLRMEKYRDGVVSEQVLDRIMQMTVDYPIFHLFNALTMSSDYSFGRKREKTLLEIVELMNSTDSPCFPPIKFLRKGEAKSCNTTSKTPYAMQGTSVYMGDVYLKEAVRINKLEPLKASEYLDKALSVYRRPKQFKPLRTRFWKLKTNLDNRIRIVKDLKNDGEIPKQFFKSKQYLQIYKCSSCHQDGKAKKVLHVNLP